MAFKFNIFDFLDISRDNELSAWRSRAITIILIVLAATGLPAYASVVFTAIRRGNIIFLEILYISIYVVLVILALLPRLNYLVRVWGLIGVSYVNAMASFLRLGLVGSGRLWLITIPVVATVLIGSRAGYATGILSMIIYVAFSALASIGMLGEWLVLRDNPLTAGIWLEGGSALLVYLSILVVLVERFVSLQGRTLAGYRRSNVRLTETAMALKESEERLRTIGDNLPGGMIYQLMAKPDGSRRFTYLSAGIERLHGLTPEQVMADSSLLYRLLHEDDVDLMRREEEKALSDMRQFDVEVRFRNNTGGVQWSRIVSQPRIAEGGIVLSDGIEIDITASKRAGEALRESETKYRLLNEELERKVAERTGELERINDVLRKTNLDLEKAFRELNATQSQLVQSEKLAALGQLSAGIAHELNTPLGAITSSIRSMVDLMQRKVPEIARLLPAFNEKERQVFDAILRESMAGPVRIDTLPDRSIRKEIVTMLKNAGIPDSDHLGRIVVDIGAQGLKERLVDLLRVGRRDDILDVVAFISSIRRVGEIITVASDKAAGVVGALQSYLKQDAGMDFENVYVNRDIDDILTLFYNKIKHGVAIKKRYITDEPVKGNRDRLNQLWMNLLNNAFQAMEWNGTVEIETKKQDGFISVSIIDSGPGIEDSIRDRIFEPFFTTKKYGEGMGLGLDICKKIVEIHDGRIEFDSVPGKTRFTVFLKPGEM
jgi:PAS domain S-box-containing protein